VDAQFGTHTVLPVEGCAHVATCGRSTRWHTYAARGAICLSFVYDRPLVDLWRSSAAGIDS